MTRAPELVAPVEQAPVAEEGAPRHRSEVASTGMRALLVAGGVCLSLVPWIDLLDGGWQTVVVAFVLTLVGVSTIARLLGAGVFAPLAAIVVAVPWLTLATAPQEAIAGLIPTRSSLAASGASIVEGMTQLLFTPGPPVPMTPDVVGVLLVAALALWLVVDGLLALGVPALAATPLLLPAIMTMAYRIELDPLRLVPAAIAMAAFLVLGRRERARGRALVSAVAVVLAAVVAPAVMPAPRDADIPWPRWMQGPASGGVASGPPQLSTGIDLAEDLRRGSPVRIFDYAPSDGLPMLTRLTSLQGIGPDGFVEERGELTTSFEDMGATAAGDAISTQFTLGRAFIGNVPIPVQATSTADFSGTWRWDPASQSIGFTDPERLVSLNDQTYTVASVRPTPIPEGESPDSTGAQEALEVPDDAASFVELADDIVDADAPPLERAQQIEAYMTDGTWDYSETVPLEGFGTTDGGQWSALERFMDARSGYCVHYASATAILARAAGIPARISIGFLPGTDPQADGTYTVTTNDMHAWAELWFDGYGWVPFDTTPGIAAGGTVASAEGRRRRRRDRAADAAVADGGGAVAERVAVGVPEPVDLGRPGRGADRDGSGLGAGGQHPLESRAARHARAARHRARARDPGDGARGAATTSHRRGGRRSAVGGAGDARGCGPAGADVAHAGRDRRGGRGAAAARPRAARAREAAGGGGAGAVRGRAVDDARQGCARGDRGHPPVDPAQGAAGARSRPAEPRARLAPGPRARGGRRRLTRRRRRRRCPISWSRSARARRASTRHETSRPRLLAGQADGRVERARRVVS